MKVGQFISKNIVALVMVPALVGAHYGWYRLQHVDELVSPEDRNKLPITKAPKKVGMTESTIVGMA